MRILPIALADPSLETEGLVMRAHRSSRVTHGAPACLVACALYVLVARKLLAGRPMPPLRWIGPSSVSARSLATTPTWPMRSTPTSHGPAAPAAGT